MQKLIAGVDEAGRGPLIGAVVTAAVILPAEFDIPNLDDSKKITKKKREILYELIIDQACCWAVGRAEAEEIDQLNILHATMLAMRRSIEALSIKPDHVQVDGNRCPHIEHICSVEAIIRGDGLIPCISAASIIAKVTRDREMLALHARFPEYGFAKHNGYPTPEHLAALEKYGVLAEHRKSFAPVKKLLS